MSYFINRKLGTNFGEWRTALRRGQLQLPLVLDRVLSPIALDSRELLEPGVEAGTLASNSLC